MRRILLFLAFPLLALPCTAADTPRTIRVLVWDEQQPAQKQAYPNFLGNAIADHLRKFPEFSVKSARLDDSDQGLSEKTLDETDVLIWWGHVRHGEIKPDKAKAIAARVKAGRLTLVALHSAHFSKPFIESMNERSRIDALKSLPEADRAQAVIEEIVPKYDLPKRDEPLTPRTEVTNRADGTKRVRLYLPNCCFPAYREDGKPSHVKVLDPKNPLAAGLPVKFDIPATEMYEDPFHVPKPDATVFQETWDAGETFRSGLIWKIGQGTVIYFRPGHETHPIYLQAEPLKVIENAARGFAPKAQ